MKSTLKTNIFIKLLHPPFIWDFNLHISMWGRFTLFYMSLVPCISHLFLISLFQLVFFSDLFQFYNISFPMTSVKYILYFIIFIHMLHFIVICITLFSLKLSIWFIFIDSSYLVFHLFCFLEHTKNGYFKPLEFDNFHTWISYDFISLFNLFLRLWSFSPVSMCGDIFFEFWRFCMWKC